VRAHAFCDVFRDRTALLTHSRIGAGLARRKGRIMSNARRNAKRRKRRA
jgi:hypothetical protein